MPMKILLYDWYTDLTRLLVVDPILAIQLIGECKILAPMLQRIRGDFSRGGVIASEASVCRAPVRAHELAVQAREPTEAT